MVTDLSDEELLLDDDAQTFALLYERRCPLIRGYLRRRVGPHPELVLDLVAETFARALERREQFDDRKAGARGGALCLDLSAHRMLRAGRAQARIAWPGDPQTTDQGERMTDPYTALGRELAAPRTTRPHHGDGSHRRAACMPRFIWRCWLNPTQPAAKPS
jgi:DNA-directed RNA polymerase specialized sigma24 family protein